MLHNLYSLRGTSTITSFHRWETGAKKDSMACLMSHRKSIVEQGTKQIFQVLGLKQLELKYSFMFIMQSIFELQGITRIIISHEEMPRTEKVCSALFGG